MTHPFHQWFAAITGHASPRQWQDELAAESGCRSKLIRIPTGLGKTEGVLAAWSYHRLDRADAKWPRRLVWCLPMRVLVEQTEEVARELTSRMPKNHAPQVYVAMGGEDAGEWFLHPESPAIIIGTQDMLLSRALNRGYASGRARWPVEFGLLSQDALWVMDEVQLMDVGLATSAQLQTYRDSDIPKSLQPCHTWWMSATLQPDWLRSIDTAEHHATWIQEPSAVPPAERIGGLWDIRKSLITDAIGHNDADTFASRILAEHAASTDLKYGRITLVVCNTVDRACKTFDALQAHGRTNGIELVHGRFRPAEREVWRKQFLSRAACTSDANRIIVATQVVEAGVDISAVCLITELAPWPSLVQRFGRCARYGGSGRVIVVDRGRDDAAPPYLPEVLESAWESLRALRDVGISALELHEETLTPESRATLFPYAPDRLLLRREFDELFDTTSDLTGADVDISRFIRSGDERDLQVFWPDLGKSESPPLKLHPQRRELCAVPFLKARDWLCGEETKTNRKPRLRGGMRAWVWDWIDGEWVEVTRASLVPGRIVCVAAACGGYRKERGFDPASKANVPIPQLDEVDPETQELEEADDQQDAEIPGDSWKTIACHTSEVAVAAKEIAEQLNLSQGLQDTLQLAAIWHDWGKSHPAFQGAMCDNARPARIDLAKGPKGAWRKPPNMYRFLDGSESRPGFRHELASAVGLFAILQTYAPQHPALLGPWSEVLAKLGKSPSSGNLPPVPSPLIQRLLDCSAEQFNLLAYLVASHHGKVRIALHAGPKDQEYRDNDGRGLPIRGVREGDQLPSIAIVPGERNLPAVALTLSPAAIGLSEKTGISWRERSIGLMERYGPAGLAFLEAVLRAADVRASRLKTNDPALTTEAGK
jgi:CRISPR-associated endonuclease/helicase Cas3